MLNIFNFYKEIFQNNIKKISLECGVDLSKDDLENFTIEPTKDKIHGDIACNIAMTLSKKFSHIEELKNPQNLAKKIISQIVEKNIEKCEIAGYGFINIFIKPSLFYDVIIDLIKKDFTFPNLGNGISINLEYASPNPTGPMHVGHTRGAIYGDVLGNLLQKVGYKILREYYINDAGSQILSLLKSVYLRYLELYQQEREFMDCRIVKKEKDGIIYFEILGEFYPGDYLIDVAKSIKEKFRDSLLNKKQDEIFDMIRDFSVECMMKMIKSDLEILGIKHDSYFSEKKNLHDNKKIEEVIKILQEKDLIYIGKLEDPKGKEVNESETKDSEKADQLLFKSTNFGDDQDRVIQKSDGSYTYFAGDIAYVASKFERGAKIFIMPLGYDHAGYVKRLTAVVSAITNNSARLKIILCQMVKFVKDGQPLKMSKRAGNFITARQVVEEVGSDALRFIMLTRKNDSLFDFDLAKVIEQSKDNPIFYVQYAHARCCSVLRNCPKEILEKIDNFDVNILQNLKDESEINLLKKISNFPRVIEMSAINFEPHRLAFYLQELSSEFHALWNKGIENSDLKFIITENEKLTIARIYMILATRKIISIGLEIFSIKALEEMR